jgi:hypothetical protein
VDDYLFDRFDDLLMAAAELGQECELALLLVGHVGDLIRAQSQCPGRRRPGAYRPAAERAGIMPSSQEALH